MPHSELRELARLYSIQIAYTDAAGKRRTASREALLAALRSRIPDGASLDEALKLRRAELAARRVEPVIVLWGQERLRIPFRGITLEGGERFTAVNEPLPFGYHTLHIDEGLDVALFVAPARAPAAREKTWGVFAPLYSMHTERTWGIGDLGDLQRYQQWVHDLGGSFVATLPMNAIDAEHDPSPYSPISRLYWNELYLDVTQLPEYRGEPLPPLPLERTVDYKSVANVKRDVLTRMAQRFVPDAEFDCFAKTARDYAQFRGDVRYHLYVQYRMAQQMRRLSALYLDFPLGVNRHGYDAWRYSGHFAKSVSVGAPPDLFFTKGQNWGFPPLDPDAIRARGHEYFRECVRHAVRHARILRIDHVMGLHRLFWIPEGMDPNEGVYVRYPAGELYAVLAIESHRANSVIVGEDLGTVPESVPRTMKKRGIRRMYVVQYELKAEGREPVGLPPAASIAGVNTHDMPTFAGYWNGGDIEDRLTQGLLDAAGAEEERARRDRIRAVLANFLTARGLLPRGESATMAVFEALLRFLGSSDAEFALVNLEDCWLEEEPQNVPGVAQRSWRHRMQLSLPEAQCDPRVTRLLRAMNGARRGMDGNEK